MRAAALALVVTATLSPDRAAAADRVAIASGNWSEAATWTGSLVPGAGDRAFIGSTTPAGSAAVATVSLTQNQTAGEVLLGIGAGTAGTLQLNNFNLTTGQMVLGDGAGGTATVLRGTGTLTVTDRLTVNGTGGNSFSFASGDVVANLRLVSGGRASTLATSNVTGEVTVAGAGSRLTLGAALSTSAFNTVSVSGGGVLDAQGFAITTPGSGRLSIGAGSSLVNRGALTVGNLDVAGQPFALTPADAVGSFELSGGATASTSAAGNVTGRVSVSGAGSRLTLGADLTLGSGSVLNLSGGGALDAQGRGITLGGFSVMSLDAASSLLNRGALAVGGSLNVTGQPFALTPADAVNTFSLSGPAATTALAAGVGVGRLNLAAGATATTAAAGNVRDNVSVSGAGSRLTLGADLALTDLLSVVNGGTLNAQGRNITANFGVRVGTSGGVAAVLQNLGTVTTAGSYNQSGGSQVTLGAGASAVGSLTLTENSSLAIEYLTGSAGQLTVTGTSAGAVSIEAGSRLAFTLDGGQPGYALRWANPAGGDHVADLTALIASGAVTVSLTNGAMSQVTSDGSFTYLVQPVPEPALLLLAAAGGLAVVRARRRAGR